MLKIEGNGFEEFDVWFSRYPVWRIYIVESQPLIKGSRRIVHSKLPPGTMLTLLDFKTDTPYKPQLAGGFNSPTVFTIVDNTTAITNITFSLEAEYRMSHEFAPVEGTVTVAGKDEVDHVFFDLFPVVDGVRQTEYPVYSFGLDGRQIVAKPR